METILLTSTNRVLAKDSHHYRFEVVDYSQEHRYCHYNIAMSGEHTQTSNRWQHRLVKNEFMNIEILGRFRDYVSTLLTERGDYLVSMTPIFIEDRRQFGFSIVTAEMEKA
jgi:hypothetical protein